MKAQQNQVVYDVIIAGGGPVGLFLACELALARCSVLVLEKAAQPHSPLKQLPFGLRGLNAPSVAALHRALAVAVDGDPDLAVYDGEVTSAGRIELLPFVHEQAITITAHRYGNPDDWSAEVI